MQPLIGWLNNHLIFPQAIFWSLSVILKHCLVLPQSWENSSFAACLSALIVMIKKKCCSVHCFCWGGTPPPPPPPHFLCSTRPLWCFIDRTNSFCSDGFTIPIPRMWNYFYNTSGKKLRLYVISKVNPYPQNILKFGVLVTQQCSITLIVVHLVEFMQVRMSVAQCVPRK